MIYLSDILEYLNQKGMSKYQFEIFKTSIDESSKFGLKEIVMPTELLKNIFAVQSEFSSKKKKKKSHDTMREVIFDAALQVFAEKGYHKSTIDEIASLSGIGKGTVYRHFKSKEELLKQLLAEKYEDIMERIGQIFSRDYDVLQQIREMIELWVSFIEENHVVYRLIQNDTIVQIAGENMLFYDYFIEHLPMFKERILALNKEDKLKTTSFYTVFYGILGFIDGVVQKWFRHGMNYSLKDEIPVIIEVLFNGFVGENKTGRNFLE